MIKDGAKKPFLGGYRILPYNREYHHAETQTVFQKRTWSEKYEGETFALIFLLRLTNWLFSDCFSRGSQTFPKTSKMMQTSKEISTQTPTPGIHISSKNDKIIVPSSKYRTSAEFRIIQMRAVSLLNVTFYRSF